MLAGHLLVHDAFVHLHTLALCVRLLAPADIARVSLQGVHGAIVLLQTSLVFDSYRTFRARVRPFVGVDSVVSR